MTPPPTTPWHIRPYRPDDAATLSELYNYYVCHTTIAFETDPISAQEMARRATVICAHSPYLVAEQDGHPIGYTYAKPWHHLPAYAHTYESTIYLAHNRHRQRCRGLGSALYQALLDELRNRGNVRVLFGVPTLGNTASDRLHAKLGFQKQAIFHHVGYKHQQWLGVTYWAITLNEDTQIRANQAPK